MIYETWLNVYLEGWNESEGYGLASLPRSTGLLSSLYSGTLLLLWLSPLPTLSLPESTSNGLSSPQNESLFSFFIFLTGFSSLSSSLWSSLRLCFFFFFLCFFFFFLLFLCFFLSSSLDSSLPSLSLSSSSSSEDFFSSWFNLCYLLYCRSLKILPL